jgi:hypothetical protein
MVNQSRTDLKRSTDVLSEISVDAPRRSRTSGPMVRFPKSPCYAADLRELRYCKNTQCAKKDREWNDYEQRSSAHKDFLVAGHITQTDGIS